MRCGRVDGRGGAELGWEFGEKVARMGGLGAFLGAGVVTHDWDPQTVALLLQFQVPGPQIGTQYVFSGS